MCGLFYGGSFQHKQLIDGQARHVLELFEKISKEISTNYKYLGKQ